MAVVDAVKETLAKAPQGFIPAASPWVAFTHTADVSSCSATQQIQQQTRVAGANVTVPFWVTESSPSARFAELVRRWKRDTALTSSIAKAAMHSAYQEIIGMGERALPLIFEELEHRGGHWFWALRAITGEDPARGISDFDAARHAWIEWWRRRAL